ncbi:Dam family site-specific DNA-(adenine-N6)-methyltransferase [Heliobacterium gestii]|uniref:Site-specific DNA-methyltransferase (adenine-specific) n=1 Tax=Heliomicrobium gestii TaxID=2699 RepID=A0A845LB71_HELGE|nr:Dam family site-specific DNA-(adenine-N6)-methyltransferase [Heliomicrobium gestii]MBM7866129.1 DNA adenine methylase [Heliomicrobium gestii]MZP42544.1 Dam family site-specific DNA-(adenine-N6)-methyltransferase [Heliomicrobium gestii]
MRQRPFLKWAGNKYRIIHRILTVLPAGRRLIEPFAGSGAVFLNTDFRENLLSDSNDDLIRLYETVKTGGEGFLEYSRSFFTEANNCPERYYALRELFNTTGDGALKSALFIYLNRHGYNGLCRYNASGKFNAPAGRYKKPYFPEEELRFFAAKAREAQFVCQDFTQTMAMAREGDVVYCDPPYVPLSQTSNFTSYSAGGFGEAEQWKLAELARQLAERGVSVLISNHDTEFTQKAYHAARIERFQVQRFVSCNGAKRGKAGEVLALFG